MAARGKRRSSPPGAVPPATAGVGTAGASAAASSAGVASLSSASSVSRARRGSFTKVPSFPSAYEAMTEEPEDERDFATGLDLQLGEPSTGPGGAVAADAQRGRYAYSTTLRRQPSAEPAGFGAFGGAGRSSSPHHASPFQRTASYRHEMSPRAGHHPLSGEPEQPSLFGRVMDAGRKAMGKRGYEEIRIDEEERRRSQDRRHRETPSAIYAHRSVEVRLLRCAAYAQLGLIGGRTPSRRSRQMQQPGCRRLN